MNEENKCPECGKETPERMRYCKDKRCDECAKKDEENKRKWYKMYSRCVIKKRVPVRELEDDN